MTNKSQKAAKSRKTSVLRDFFIPQKPDKRLPKAKKRHIAVTKSLQKIRQKLL